MFKKKVNILAIIKYIILFIITLIIVSVMGQLMVNKNKTPNFFGYKIYVVLTGSMEPEINIGDVVIVKNDEVVAPGNIVAYREGRTIIIHRVVNVKIENNTVYLITKGDANKANDIFPIDVKNVEGKCVGVIPYLGYIFIIVYKYWILIIVALVVLIIVRLILQIIKKGKAVS